MAENEKINERLKRAKDRQDDEFYTQYSDIERELRYYESKFVGKRIYCNCDNPLESAFFRYFHLNFNRLRLRSLTATHLSENRAFYARYTGSAIRMREFMYQSRLKETEILEVMSAESY